MNETTKYLVDWIEENQSDFTEMSDHIWETPELAFKEFTASRIQADYLEKAGFSDHLGSGRAQHSLHGGMGPGRPYLGFHRRI